MEPTALGSHRHDTRRIGVDSYSEPSTIAFTEGYSEAQVSTTSEPSTFFSC